IARPADYNELIFSLGRFTVKADSVEVLSNGRGGGPAVIRVTGVMRPIPFIDSIGRTLFRSDYSELTVAVDYELQPGAEHIDVFFDINNPTDAEISFVKQGILAMQTKRMPLYAPGDGFEVGGTAQPFLAYIDPDATSYALSFPGTTITSLLEISGVNVLAGADLTLPAQTNTRIHMARVHVGGPGLDELREAYARSEGLTTRAITGRVLEADGSPAEGARVHAIDAAGEAYITRASTDATGAYTLHVPSDAAVQLHAYRRGDGLAPVVNVAAGAGTANDLTFPAAGFIHVAATTVESMGATPAPAPVRVQVINTGAVARPGTAEVSFDAFGEPRLPGGDREHVEFPLDGDATMRVAAGTYRVVVSRGYEYEIFDDAAVVVTADNTTELMPSLVRSVSSTNMLCADFHIHTSRSPDAGDTGDDKLRYALGDGLEIPVRTDHEFVATFEPNLARLGVDNWAFGVSALEFTTFDYGHFGVFPLEADPTRPNGGAFQWRDLSDEGAAGLARLRPAPEVFEEIAARPSSPALIIFHPRGLGVPGAYFTASGYDPDTGVATNTELWDEDAFSVVETFNDSSFAENFDSTVEDWFSFLNRGKHVASVGDSDSHDVMAGSPVGYPRTCVIANADDPDVFRSSLDASDLRDLVLGGRMVVSGGVLLTATTDTGEGPGQEVNGASATESIHVTVQAPTWIDVTTLEVYVNGVLDGTVAVPTTGNALRLEMDVAVNIPAGASYVVFHARGDVDGTGAETSTLAPVHPNRAPFGVTNPIYFQR
ncbi:MAG: carboxypeptidase regulatory-like domain-containing protein, partial [Myxococcales bacterium]|nr:carboxypeptidase regulatory-like domain-containing protein [Myxococcales bacterium]